MSFSFFQRQRSTILWLFTLCAISLIFIGCSQTQNESTGSSGKLSPEWREPRPAKIPLEDSSSPLDVFPESVDTPDAISAVQSESPAAGSANQRILSEAREAIGESSRNGPDGGNLACAWMVNKILDRAVGYKVNGDSTTTMNQVFRSHVASGRAQQIPASQAQPGDIIISPTTWTPTRNTGHVGIVGENGVVMSNSSSRARWEENFTAESWFRRYEQQKGLRTYIYRITT